MDNGVKHLVVQPTHLMLGAEHDELFSTVTEYMDQFDSVKMGMPLLGPMGTETTEVNEDKERVASAVLTQAIEDGGYERLEDAEQDGTAFVFIGHGTSHTANVAYSQMQTQFNNMGCKNVFVGTVEGKPEETSCENVIASIKEAGYKRVILRPMMVVAGDHANNDIAGEEEDSWKSMFEKEGFESVDCQIAGLGRISAVVAIYLDHVDQSTFIERKDNNEDGQETGKIGLEDGKYIVDFTTDSSMFRVNETKDGKGTLEVKDGEGTVHITLVSKRILHLYPGLAEDAAKDGAALLEPTEDEVTYEDGMTETVYGFDVPVPAIDEEFNLALIGEKGTWYDHKVKVSNPQAAPEE